MDFKISKCSGSDLKQCVPIFIKVYAKSPYNEHWSKNDAVKRLKSVYKGNKTYCFTAKLDNQVIGFILGRDYQWYDGKRVFLEELVVSEEFRRKGVGTLLWNAFENRLKSRGVVLVQGLVNSNSTATRFYKKISLGESDYKLFEKKVRRFL